MLQKSTDNVEGEIAVETFFFFLAAIKTIYREGIKKEKECYGKGGLLGEVTSHDLNGWQGGVASWLGGRKGPRSNPWSATVFHTGVPLRHDD